MFISSTGIHTYWFPAVSCITNPFCHPILLVQSAASSIVLSILWSIALNPAGIVGFAYVPACPFIVLSVVPDVLSPSANVTVVGVSFPPVWLPAPVPFLFPELEPPLEATTVVSIVLF